MTRLIDADKLENRKFVGLVHGDAEENTYRLGWNNAIEAIMDNEPTAERPKGEWKAFDLNYGRSFYYCTVCKETEDLPPTRWFKFCPNCGAEMRGGQDDDTN